MVAHSRCIAWVLMVLTLAVLPRAATAGIAAFTFKGGLSMARMSVDSEFFDPELKLGVSGGIAAQVALTEAVSIQPEVLYVMKGFSFGELEARDEAGTFVGTFESFVSVDYLEIPVLVRLAVPTHGSVSPYVLLGPAFAFETRERFEMRGAIDASGDSELFDGFDLGIAAGAGVEFGHGRNGVMIEGRYTYGLTNLEYATLDTHNMDVQVVAGWVYRTPAR